MVKFYTLLHLNQGEKSVHNVQVKDFESQINLYIGCVLNLKNSLAAKNISLTLLTNNKALLMSTTSQIDLDIIEIEFSLNVPTGINFYSAHFKIDVYKYFSTLTAPYVGLIDSDMMCINNIPLCLENIISSKLAVYYNITDQVAPAYGHEKILREKQMISPSNKIGLWAGGEFIMGSPDFFSLLYGEVLLVKDNYFKIWPQLHHQSDEFLTSVAIENIVLNNKDVILDGGKLGIVARYWNANTLHVQSDINAYTNSFLLHLPCDKLILAKAGRSNLSSSQFMLSYKKLIKSKTGLYELSKKMVKHIFQR